MGTIQCRSGGCYRVPENELSSLARDAQIPCDFLVFSVSCVQVGALSYHEMLARNLNVRNHALLESFNNIDKGSLGCHWTDVERGCLIEKVFNVGYCALLRGRWHLSLRHETMAPQIQSDLKQSDGDVARM